MEIRKEWENSTKEYLENSGGSESPKESPDSELPDSEPPDSEPPDSMVSRSPLVFVSKKFWHNKTLRERSVRIRVPFFLNLNTLFCLPAGGKSTIN